MVTLSEKLTKSEREKYISVCEQIWGCVPVDVNWATETKIFKEAYFKMFPVNQNRPTVKELNEMLDRLGPEKLNKIFDEVAAIKFEGPTVDEYFTAIGFDIDKD